MPDTLEVHLYGRHVADLHDAGFGMASVQYTAEGRAAGPAGRLSLSLPVREEPYPGAGPAMRWLRGLLPEGHALQAAAQEYRVPADDVFALLSVIGRDMAGAAMILRPGETPDAVKQTYRRLDARDLEALIRDVRDQPLGLNRERGVRLSLAGVQDKLVLHRPPRSRTWYQPLQGAPSTVVVKPEPLHADGPPFPGLATNESLCLALARRCGLDAAQAEVVHIADRPCLVVRRYDRSFHADLIERVHQEDFLSAMGRDPWLKYEGENLVRLMPGGGFGEIAPVRNEPGPSLDDLAELVRQHLGRVGLVQLMQVVTFNVLIGNADAHARNLSLLLLPDGSVRLAPLYDLVATRLYEEITPTASQRVYGEEDIDAITMHHLWAHFASWALPTRVLARVPALLQRALRGLSATTEETVRKGGDPAHAHRVAELVRLRAERLLAS